MNNIELTTIEINILLTALLERYGYDFTNYSKATLKRRILNFLGNTEYEKISEMIPQLLYDESFCSQFIQYLSITVTEMFRDPKFFLALRQKVVPYLKTYPFIKTWHAGCATGEEVYSMAVVLKEEGLYDNTTIFGTDFNDVALRKAKEGIYSMKNAGLFIKNYKATEGNNSFSEYYHSKYDSIIIDKSLKKNITFANHNLVTDGVFGEMHLIVCRNTLIYFDNTLQKRVLGLFKDSLAPGGFLALGSKETLRFSGFENDFREIDRKWRIYQKGAC